MNTLQIIKEQIEKQSALHNARLAHTAYRGVKTLNIRGHQEAEKHGTFCYRGQTYTK